MINQYKRTDVFRCRLDSHRSFNGKVSVYHVLKARNCLPDGCFYFKWHCGLLEKGGTCRKGYKNPGKNCGSCRYFHDEKLHKVPEIKLSEQEYRRFELDLDYFEDWLAENEGRRLDIYGRVNYVGPRLVETVHRRGSRLRLRGYLANFTECFLGRTHFEDLVYLSLSPGSQDRLRLARGDLLEFSAELTVDEGRLVLVRPRRIEFQERGGESFDPARSEALVDYSSARPLDEQYDKCLGCERGRLVDVVERHPDGERFLARELYCLEGMEGPEECCYNALKEIGIRG